MQSLIESILAKPALYCGKGYATIDEFSLFFSGLSLGLGAEPGATSPVSEEDKLAVQAFGCFMRHYLHGENKNCHWEYDLLSRQGSQSGAVQAASALLRFFRNRIAEDGGNQVDAIIARANCFRASRQENGDYQVVELTADET